MSFTASIIADCHLNKASFKEILDKKTGLPFKTSDHLNSFKWAIDQNINVIKPDILVIAGDSYENFDPSNDIRAFFNEQIYRVAVENKIRTYILVGNHEICMKHHALLPLKSLRIPNLFICEEPFYEKFMDYDLFFFPYSINIERGLIDEKAQFKDFADQIKKLNVNPDKSIFFGHIGIKGASLKNYVKNGVEKKFLNTSDGVSVDDLDSLGVGHIVLGDYHSHQKMPTKNCFSMYCGSIEISDISEIDQEKGFIVYDSSAEIGELGKCRFVKYPNTRKHIDVAGSLIEIKDKIKKTSNDSLNPFVRIRFIGHEKEVSQFASSLDSIKKSIREKFNPIHIIDDQKITYDEVVSLEQETNRIQEIVSKKGYIEEEDVIGAAEDMLKAKIQDNDKFEELIKIAKDVYHTSRGQ
jgi:DNA repair exonuclease SbcCD nuclease subunit